MEWVIVGIAAGWAAVEHVRMVIWRKAYENEVRLHAEAVERHESVIQQVANQLRDRNILLEIDNKPVFAECQVKPDPEWPEII